MSSRRVQNQPQDTASNLAGNDAEREGGVERENPCLFGGGAKETASMRVEL